MIAAAEADGRLRPGGCIFEATAGNTGLALALVAARRGYRLSVVVPDKMSDEKIASLRSMGAEVRGGKPRTPWTPRGHGLASQPTPQLAPPTKAGGSHAQDLAAMAPGPPPPPPPPPRRPPAF
jgi:hypothetical protein